MILSFSRANHGINVPIYGIAFGRDADMELVKYLIFPTLANLANV